MINNDALSLILNTIMDKPKPQRRELVELVEATFTVLEDTDSANALKSLIADIKKHGLTPVAKSVDRRSIIKGQLSDKIEHNLSCITGRDGECITHGISEETMEMHRKLNPHLYW